MYFALFHDILYADNICASLYLHLLRTRKHGIRYAELTPVKFVLKRYAMELKIGEIIKALRKRDGRTQDDLATAVGITSQAVSRWELGLTYPDMELVPGIANFFHVTIDELFGYSSDREEKIRRYCEDADEILNGCGDMTPCVSLLRTALSEFPTEIELLERLGYALFRQGVQKKGSRGFTADGCDYAQTDVAYNSQNEYWQEALSVFERVLDMGVSGDRKTAIICVAVNIYSAMGMFDKAKVLANKQDSLIISREVLLSSATELEEKERYTGESILALIRGLKNAVQSSVLSKLSLATTQIGVQKLLDTAHLYESVLDGEDCGLGHSDLCDLYMMYAIFTSRLGDLPTALRYFDVAFSHGKKYNEIRSRTGEYHYTGKLVSKVTFPCRNFPVQQNSVEVWLSCAPQELTDAVKSMPKYAECFV